MRYEIRFVDDSVGRAVKDGEAIDLEYHYIRPMVIKLVILVLLKK